MAAARLAVDRARSAERIERDVETLAGPDYTLSSEAIRRYAYTEVYRNTLAYFTDALERLGFVVYQDPVGTLVARNRPRGENVFGIGSHCDSNRNGGRYDGTLGVVIALEVCRLRSRSSRASGAAHDTMCVAAQVPSAMVFVPCKDGISHSPLEEASPADAAIAAEVVLGAVAELVERGTHE